MDDLDKDLVLQWYEWLEEQLLDIMRYLPPAPENLYSYSPRLASLIVEACGLLDSILRQITPDPVAVGGKSKPRRYLDIVDYAELYANTFGLPTLKSILLLPPPKYLCPFAPWTALAPGGGYAPLPWWSTHTDLKHDRIANLKKAGLAVAIDALSALHQVIAVVPDLGRTVLRRGLVPGRKPNPDIVIEVLEGRTAANWTLLVETRLFAVPRGREKFPETIAAFSPAFFNGSDRLIDFFGRW